jgi:cell wall-associated NlpC family hydrolase
MSVDTDLSVGQHAAVGVAVATLWSAPTAPRAVDAPALGVPSDAGRWVTGLTPDQQVHEGVLSQLLLGERVLVEEIRDGWVRVVALEQPAAKLDPRGYPGWLPAAQLTRGGRPDGPAYLVDTVSTTLRDTPDGAIRIADVALGTRLVAAGPPRSGWLPVHVPGRITPLWALQKELVPVPAEPASGADALALARRLAGTTYVWGGLSAAGIDCSGLVHLVWRRYGVRLPRDADDQFHATVPVPAGEERPGDLYFFARHGKPVHHIGFVAAPPDHQGEGGRHLLHACYTQRRVVSEPVCGDRQQTLIGARRVDGLG